MKFSEWFEQQAGPRPSGKEWHDLRQDVFAARAALKKAKQALRVYEDWETRKTFALSAWQISEEDKK